MKSQAEIAAEEYGTNTRPLKAAFLAGVEWLCKAAEENANDYHNDDLVIEISKLKELAGVK